MGKGKGVVLAFWSFPMVNSVLYGTSYYWSSLMMKNRLYIQLVCSTTYYTHHNTGILTFGISPSTHDCPEKNLLPCFLCPLSRKGMGEIFSGLSGEVGEHYLNRDTHTHLRTGTGDLANRCESSCRRALRVLQQIIKIFVTSQRKGKSDQVRNRLIDQFNTFEAIDVRSSLILLHDSLLLWLPVSYTS